MVQRKLPARLKEKAGERTDVSIKALRKAMTDMRSEIEARDFDLIRPLTIQDVLKRAGLNPKFLYGSRHKGSTKVEVESFVNEVNAASERRDRAEPEDTPLARARADAEHWQARHARLASHVNGWFVEMRTLRRRIRDLELINAELKSGSERVIRLVRDPTEVPHG